MDSSPIALTSGARMRPAFSSGKPCLNTQGQYTTYHAALLGGWPTVAQRLLASQDTIGREGDSQGSGLA
jgi:hypothetical protein